ncbi:hypothetical protein CXB41_08440 [Pseudomonas syringae pv. syringae]|nr:hypothetical protein CXB41_08440 [Pseudomonas syringae pv. syringae]
MWERACSRRRCIRRTVFEGCTGPFASKLAPTGVRAGAPSSGCSETLVEVASNTRPMPGP